MTGSPVNRTNRNEKSLESQDRCATLETENQKEILKQVQDDEPCASFQFITAKPPLPEQPLDHFVTVETVDLFASLKT